MKNDEIKMPKVDPVYFFAVRTRNKLVWLLDWLLMRVHTWRTGIKHDGADPRIKQ
jgi:hypothetical protein